MQRTKKPKPAPEVGQVWKAGDGKREVVGVRRCPAGAIVSVVAIGKSRHATPRVFAAWEWDRFVARASLVGGAE